MIEVEGLHKSFGTLRAVDGLSFRVGEGEIFGLLGPNGAGKTTTINMLCGVLRPDAGHVRLAGHDVWAEPLAAKRLLGVVPQEIALYEDLTARDNLSFWGSLYGLGGKELKTRVNEALARVGLAERAGHKVATFSGGMKRRLNLCMGLLPRPRVLLLDEPTAGIDPQARLGILDLVRDVARAGATVLYTTHYMDEAEELCDRIAIIDHGRILTTGTIEELSRLAGEGEVIRLNGSFAAAAVRDRLASVPGARVLGMDETSAVLVAEPDGGGLLAVLPRLLAADLGIEAVSIQRPSLQSVFIRLTGRELRD